MTTGSQNVFTKIIGAEAAAPSTPSANTSIAYVKADGLWYSKDDAGTETLMSGGSGMTNPLTTTGDIIYSSSGTTAARRAIGSTGDVLTVAGGVPTWAAAASGGTTYGQVIPYPTSFSGDTINGSSTAPFVDVAAFDTKEVLNSRVLHLQTKGASKDQKVRVTLGTTKAGAFDVRVAIAFAGLPWSSADNNTYADVRLTTAAGAALLANSRLQGWGTDSMGPLTQYVPIVTAKFGGSTTAAIGDNFTPMSDFGEILTLRFVRDGSNVISYSAVAGTTPLTPVGIRIRSNYEPYTQTVSGTLACIEFAIHTPSGPGAAVEYDVWIDYLSSV